MTIITHFQYPHTNKNEDRDLRNPPKQSSVWWLMIMWSICSQMNADLDNDIALGPIYTMDHEIRPWKMALLDNEIPSVLIMKKFANAPWQIQMLHTHSWMWPWLSKVHVINESMTILMPLKSKWINAHMNTSKKTFKVQILWNLNVIPRSWLWFVQANKLSFSNLWLTFTRWPFIAKNYTVCN